MRQKVMAVNRLSAGVGLQRFVGSPTMSRSVDLPFCRLTDCRRHRKFAKSRLTVSWRPKG